MWTNKKRNSKDEDEQEDRPSIFHNPFNELSYDSYKDLIDKRIILLNGNVKEDVVERVAVPLINLSNEKPNSTVQIWINSFGGTVEDAQAVVDVIQSLKTPIVTIAFGKAMSAAFDIFLAGDLRLVYPNTILMCHSGSHSMPESLLPAFKIEAELFDEYMKRWAKFYASRTKISEAEWLTILKGGLDRYFFPEEAVEKQLAHKMILPNGKKHKDPTKIRF